MVYVHCDLTVRLHVCSPPRLTATQLTRSSVPNSLTAPTGLSPVLTPPSQAHQFVRFVLRNFLTRKLRLQSNLLRMVLLVDDRLKGTTLRESDLSQEPLSGWIFWPIPILRSNQQKLCTVIVGFGNFGGWTGGLGGFCPSKFHGFWR